MNCWTHTFLLRYEIKRSLVWAVHTSLCLNEWLETPLNCTNHWMPIYTYSHTHRYQSRLILQCIVWHPIFLWKRCWVFFCGEAVYISFVRNIHPIKQTSRCTCTPAVVDVASMSYPFVKCLHPFQKAFSHPLPNIDLRSKGLWKCSLTSHQGRIQFTLNQFRTWIEN